MMCRLLEVSPSGFYVWLGRGESRRARENRALAVEIRAVHQESHGTYGSPRVHAELQSRGRRCGQKRVASIMQAQEIVGKQRRKFKHTTDSDHDKPVAENLLGQQFLVKTPDTAWVGDITYIPTQEGWLYLAGVLDLFSRRVVGWATSSRINQDLIMEATHQALQDRRPARGLIHHSDRGSQYASKAFQGLLKDHGVVVSMSGVGNCYDNAVMESFFHSLKVEWIHGRTFRTREEARRGLFEYIEIFYNNWRRHSTLGMVSPAQYERLARVA
jgi:transposase InsO family protein